MPFRKNFKGVLEREKKKLLRDKKNSSFIILNFFFGISLLCKNSVFELVFMDKVCMDDIIIIIIINKIESMVF